MQPKHLQAGIHAAALPCTDRFSPETRVTERRSHRNEEGACAALNHPLKRRADNCIGCMRFRETTDE
ncbi:hypothetical protein PPGU19_025700 [Paraburkholderia sp. PGU19]|nr:hypothetical protein PPGU19_025700 [Paraburkholderia sp. PGU19]